MLSSEKRYIRSRRVQAMTELLFRVRHAFARLADSLADPSKSHASAATLLVGYVLTWWVYALIAKSTQDIHFDMGEVVSWSLVPAYGYPKHPPFPAWVASGWFAVFPYADWAFYLLSVVSVGIGLWFVWLIASRYVEGYNRVIALTMLTFSPGFNFQPLKFNSNALLIPVWAAASYLFLRSFAERNFFWGAAAGLAAAVAMLTKYWSIFLILGFVAAALTHPKCLDYLYSPAPWASAGVGALVMVPNILSLIEYDFQPFQYATAAHEVTNFRALLNSFADYFGGALYLAGGLAVIMFACRRDGLAARDMLLPREADRRAMAIATYTAFLAPILLALALRTRLATLWTLPMWSMLPALLLSSRHVQATRDAVAGVLIAACAIPLIAVLLSPLIAYVINREGVPNHAAHYRLIAAAVEKAWKETTSAPLRLFGSDTNIGNGSGFYLQRRPLRIDIVGSKDTPWADDVRVASDGIALVCAAQELACMQGLVQYSAGAAGMRRSDVTISRTEYGVGGMAERYVIAIVPPRR
jgi:Dolichyl-phosphate-mannose-protein mannosyltransferase